jgi:polar amino acid transport system substrate-binding protein
MKRVMKIERLLLVLALALFAATGAEAQRKSTGKASPSKMPVPSAAVLSNEDTLTNIRRRNRLDVGVASFIPWAMHDKNGNMIGYNVEVAKKLASDLGVELNLMPAGHVSLLPDLTNKRYDILITGMYPTPSRALLANFSEPYSTSKIELIASRDKMGRKDEKKDFDDDSVTIGVISGTVYVIYAATEFPKAKTQLFEDEASMIEAVANGTISAAIASKPGPEFAIKHSNGKIYKPFGRPLGEMDESFAIRKGDTDFLNYLNTWIRYYERNGWLEKQRNYWFEGTDWKSLLE